MSEVENKKERFKQTWWDTNLSKKFEEFKTWIGDFNVHSKVFVRNYVKGKGFKSIVDFGCGPATEFFGYKNDNYPITYIGVDSSEVLNRFITSQGVTALLAEVEEVPLPDSCTDVAFSRHVLEHLPTFKLALGEMIRVADKEVINVFFIPPTDEPEKIDFYAPDQLYHNRYNRKDIENFCNSNPKVKSLRWEKINEKEEVLFLEMAK